MRNIRRIGWLFLALMLAFSCSSDRVSYTPSKALGGTSCDPAVPFACAVDTLKICSAEGVLATESCESVCAGQGLVYDGVCEEISSHGHPFCRCKAGCCSDGQRVCADGTHLNVCASCTFAATTCTDYCSSYGLESGGCGPDSLSGTPSCLCRGIENGICPLDFNKCQEGLVSLCESFDRRPVENCHALCAAQGSHFGACKVSTQGPKESCECSTEAESSCTDFSPVCQGGGTDRLSFCARDGISTQSCSAICAQSGLVSLGCHTDPDRGHDVCQCAVQTN